MCVCGGMRLGLSTWQSGSWSILMSFFKRFFNICWALFHNSTLPLPRLHQCFPPLVQGSTDSLTIQLPSHFELAFIQSNWRLINIQPGRDFYEVFVHDHDQPWPETFFDRMIFFFFLHRIKNQGNWTHDSNIATRLHFIKHFVFVFMKRNTTYKFDHPDKGYKLSLWLSKKTLRSQCCQLINNKAVLDPFEGFYSSSLPTAVMFSHHIT